MTQPAKPADAAATPPNPALPAAGRPEQPANPPEPAFGDQPGPMDRPMIEPEQAPWCSECNAWIVSVLSVARCLEDHPGSLWNLPSEVMVNEELGFVEDRYAWCLDCHPHDHVQCGRFACAKAEFCDHVSEPCMTIRWDSRVSSPLVCFGCGKILFLEVWGWGPEIDERFPLGPGAWQPNQRRMRAENFPKEPTLAAAVSKFLRSRV